MLVAQRFLYLVQLDEPTDESPGLQEALRQREQRRSKAIAQMAAMRPSEDNLRWDASGTFHTDFAN
jgi:hypothetical protein